MRLTRTENAYTSSTTSADAPPPPLQTPPTPYFPFFCLSTCSNISLNDDGKKTIFTRWCNRCFWEHTPKSVTKIRAPLQPRGCPKATAPPWTLTLSCKQDQKKILINKWTILKTCICSCTGRGKHAQMHRESTFEAENSQDLVQAISGLQGRRPTKTNLVIQDTAIPKIGRETTLTISNKVLQQRPHLFRNSQLEKPPSQHLKWL